MAEWRVAYETVFEEDLDEYDVCGHSYHQRNPDTGFVDHTDFLGTEHEKWEPCALLNTRPNQRRQHNDND